jgi:hypothetical protein
MIASSTYPTREAVEDAADMADVADSRRGRTMNSFTLRAIGNLSQNPQAIVKGVNGDTPCTVFCLAGRDDRDDEIASRPGVTNLWFTAYGGIGDEIAKHAKKGDQLFVEAIVQTMMGSRSAYDHQFTVTGYRFGSRRGRNRS